MVAVEHVDRAPNLLGLAVQLSQQHERCDFCIPSIEDVSELHHDRIVSRPHWNPTLHFSNPSELEATQRFVDIPVDVSDCTMTVFSSASFSKIKNIFFGILSSRKVFFR